MKRSKFNLSNYRLLTMSPGPITPLGPPLEVLPGDSIQAATSMLIRVLPLLAPVMHPLRVALHSWFVPMRLMHENWEPFITGGPGADDDTELPYITSPASTGWPVGSLADYFGLPTGVPDMPVLAFPFRGYALIYNNFYRDQDLQTELPVVLTDGADTTTSTALVNGAWEKDYFTSARPWEQKGPAVTIPLTGDAPVKGIGIAPTTAAPGASGLTFKETNNLAGDVYANAFAGANWANWTAIKASSGAADALPQIFADLSDIPAVAVNDLRLAMALQRWAENRARFGSRYTEYLNALGVKSGDARLQLPEYLGGGKQTIQFSEVLQTAPTTDGDDTVGVGNLKGHGIGAMRSKRWRRFFSEHGFIFTFAIVRPKTMYVDGIPRSLTRRTRNDYWQPELQHIGQQEILNKEIQAAHATPDGVFGYQNRYDEYRREESGVSGEFRTTLDFWHMARELPANVALNGSFVQSNPTNRIYSVTDSNVSKLWVMANHSRQARRLVARSAKSFIY